MRSPTATACTRWRSRTPSTPTSGPSSSTTTTRCSWCSRPRRYVEHEQLTATSEVVDTGEVMVFLGTSLRDHRPARRARRAWANCAAGSRSSPTCWPRPRRGALRGRRPRRRQLRRGRRARSRRTSRSWRRRSSAPSAARRHRPALPAQARADVAAPGGRPRWSCRCRSWPSGRSTSSPRPCARTSATCSTTPSASATRWRRSTNCSPRSCRRRLARTSLADNEDMRKISAYAGIIAVPTAIAGIYGMNFEHMPELELALRLPAGAAGHRPLLRAPLPRLQAQRLAVAAGPGRCALYPRHTARDDVDSCTVTRVRAASIRAMSSAVSVHGLRRSRRPPSTRPPAAWLSRPRSLAN